MCPVTVTHMETVCLEKPQSHPIMKQCDRFRYRFSSRATDFT